jgi:hypothetical protein
MQLRRYVVYLFIIGMGCSLFSFGTCNIRGEVIDYYPDLYEYKAPYASPSEEVYLKVNVTLEDEDEQTIVQWDITKALRDMLLFQKIQIVKEQSTSDRSLVVSYSPKMVEEEEQIELTYQIDDGEVQSILCPDLKSQIEALEQMVETFTHQPITYHHEWKALPGTKLEIMTTEVLAVDFLKAKEQIIEIITNMYEAGEIDKQTIGSSIKTNRYESEDQYCTLESIRYMMHPMNCVSKLAAEHYCTLISSDHEGNGRLPTKEEWITAYRANTNTLYWWGDTFDGNRAVSDVPGDGKWKRWFTDQEILERGTAAAKNFGPRCNPWGICDMAGNVWEWTQTDRYDEMFVLKGGAWYYYYPEWYSYEHESAGHPHHPYVNVGFRCIRTAE